MKEPNKLTMRKILLLLIGVFALIGCSENEEINNPINMMLSKTEVSISTKAEMDIQISGIDIEKCTVQSEDEFIAEAKISGGKLNISASHVGETQITVKYKDIEKTCKVTVTPIVDFVGSAVTDFGITEPELRKKIESKCIEYRLTYRIEGQPEYVVAKYQYSGYDVYDTYYFDSTWKISGVKKSVYTKDSDVSVFLNITNSMVERLKYTSSFTNTKYDLLSQKEVESTENNNIYVYPDKYYAIYKQTKSYRTSNISFAAFTTNYIFFAKDLDAAKKLSLKY